MARKQGRNRELAQFSHEDGADAAHEPADYALSTPQATLSEPAA